MIDERIIMALCVFGMALNFGMSGFHGWRGGLWWMMVPLHMAAGCVCAWACWQAWRRWRAARTVLAICPGCGEPVRPDDRRAPHRQPMHYACGLRSAIGSVNHQKKLCRCFGGTRDDDAPGLSRREAAEAAAIYFHSRDDA